MVCVRDLCRSWNGFAEFVMTESFGKNSLRTIAATGLAMFGFIAIGEPLIRFDRQIAQVIRSQVNRVVAVFAGLCTHAEVDRAECFQ